MSIINGIIEAFILRIGHDVGTISEILAMLIFIFGLSLYEFIVYRLVSHRSMYNKSFHISIMIIPFFIGAIVMALQSNVVITLGTIGALAIIRFRTAVKDPVDMIYILWSIFIGITGGCQLYELSILTSITVTIVLLLINHVSEGLLKNPYILVVNCLKDSEKQLEEIIKSNSRRYKLKSRNFTSNGIDYIYQIETKDSYELTNRINECKNVTCFSLLEYDNEDVI